MVSYQVVVLPEAEEDLEALDSSVRKRCLAKIEWLASHPEVLGKKPLHNLPLELRGLQSYPVGDWRILYWMYPAQSIMKVYGVEHRSQVYKHL
jgi:mRNA-degrading endonuclease RelE of RelBE toxin-antitoxin system